MSRIVKPKGSKRPSANQAAFLAAYSKTGVVTLAAEIAGVPRRNHSYWLHNDKDYPAHFAEAHDMACDAIEAEMRRRAIEGVQKPVFYKGEVCGYITEYSDTLLAMLANGYMPEKYKQKARVEADAEVAAREVTRDGLRRLTHEELVQYEALLIKAFGEKESGPADMPPVRVIDVKALPEPKARTSREDGL